jgi:hypothetical protein
LPLAPAQVELGRSPRIGRVPASTRLGVQLRKVPPLSPLSSPKWRALDLSTEFRLASGWPPPPTSLYIMDATLVILMLAASSHPLPAYVGSSHGRAATTLCNGTARRTSLPLRTITQDHRGRALAYLDQQPNTWPNIVIPSPTLEIPASESVNPGCVSTR